MLNGIDYIRAKNKLCTEYKFCKNCPIQEAIAENFPIGHRLSCLAFERDFPDLFVSIVEQFYEVYKTVTVKEKFLEKYSNAPWSKSLSCCHTECTQKEKGKLPCSWCNWWDTEYENDK